MKCTQNYFTAGRVVTKPVFCECTPWSDYSIVLKNKKTQSLKSPDCGSVRKLLVYRLKGNYQVVAIFDMVLSM